MAFTGTLILLISALFLLSVLSSAISPRLGIPVLLIYLMLGMLAGEDGVLGIEYDDVVSAHLIGSAALAVILFDGGVGTRRDSFRVGLRPAVMLATFGVGLTAVIVAAAATLALGFDWLDALLIGAIVGSTDAAAVFSVLHGRGAELKDRVSATLEIESGANDPMAVFVTVLMVEAAATGVAPGVMTLGTFAWQMGIGAVIGVACGAGLAWAVTHLTLTAGLYPLLVLSGALFTFGLASVLEASGFLAAYLAGLVLSARVPRGLYNIQRFLDGAAWLAQIAMFLMLGLLVTPSELAPYALDGIVVALALMLLARPLAVAVSLLPFRFLWGEQLFIAWVGLRGAVPIILALFPWFAGLPDWETYFSIAFFVVLLSLTLQGWTVAPLARRLGLEVPSRTGRMQRVELGMPGQEEFELVGYRIDSDSPIVGSARATVRWPGGARLIAVVRGETVLEDDAADCLQIGDQIYLLAPSGALDAIDRRVLGEREPKRLGEREFFGEFVIRGDATLGALAGLYGFEVEGEQAPLSVDDYLRRRFPTPVVGDRLALGRLEIVVREVDAGGRVVRAGLKLPRP